MGKGSGITNNAIEFLVTLGINTKESKTNINEFLKTVSNKTIKFAFDVSVRESNKNIKEYLDKQQGQSIKIKFDVDKTASNAHLKSYIESKHYTSKVTFTVDSTQTKANFNKFLTNVKLKPIRVDFQLPTDRMSTAQANRVLSKIKPNTLNTILGINIEKSKTNILRQIKNIRLPEIKVNLTADTSKLTAINNLQKNIIKNQQKVNNSTKNNTSNTTTQAPSKLQSSPSNLNSPSSIFLGNYTGNKDAVVKQIKSDMEKINKEVFVFRRGIEAGQEEFINKLLKQGYRVQSVFDPVTNEITKVTATIKNSANEIETSVFKRFNADYQTSQKNGQGATKTVQGFIHEVDKLDNKNFANFHINLANLEQELENLRHKGYLNVQQFDKLSTALSSAKSNNDLDDIAIEMDRLSNSTKNSLEMTRARSEALKRQNSILAQLRKTEQLYRRTVDKDQANEVRRTINSYTSQIETAKTLADIKRINFGLDTTQQQVRKINAEATEATKNSMGMMDALKVAMEKFPIWMVASTMFYGAVRTATTFASVIVDIDKKMTDLKKVMSEDTDFGKVFEDATHSAETFGQSISSTLDAYNEFAKQGFKGDELQYLSNAGLVASNVGDIEAKKASEYMTASLLQWEMQAKDSMSIIDKWNELSNDYATSVEQLAQGQAKAGATARAMGLDFDQLNAMIGLVTASTRQSGHEVGK